VAKCKYVPFCCTFLGAHGAEARRQRGPCTVERNLGTFQRIQSTMPFLLREYNQFMIFSFIHWNQRFIYIVSKLLLKVNITERK
jgi:hypothetical protein